MRPKIIAFDFDGVLAEYNGWRGADVLGDPIPGAKECVNNLRKQGYSVVVFSVRPAWRLRDWAERWGFEFDGYNNSPQAMKDGEERSGKVIADLYVDDRAFRFTGDWKEVAEAAITLTDKPE